ncbi:hypothetical protein DW352_03600 [Pseudolabrys taiwanensis]|uniref:Peptidase M10 metallopeptidase domain-containing protein n=1 Tax=Pseudolabrys taiwanensis TaxID=331696 RepID=A0A345ZRY5_9HYPH|nr:hypothetical protein [Pseudolabrys taiwanensis]AXK79682.1 hypothetical protein DW352_03600 [Pseudolabrys taiwanensis]
MKILILRSMLLSCAFLLANIGLAYAQNAGSGKTYDLCVMKFAKIDFTESELDQVLARATQILSQASSDAPSCDKLAVRRVGPITSYDDDLPRSVATGLDFEKLTSVPCVKVVQRISWCSGPILRGGALGCSPVPGTSMVVVRTFPGLDHTFNQGVEPVTWLHELGHTLGLPHNDADNLDVMAPGISPATVRVAIEECEVYAGLRPGALMVAGAASPNDGNNSAAMAVPRIMPAESASPADKNASPVPLEEFVKKPFGVEQISAAEAYKDQVRTAETLLFDPSYLNFKNNIVALLAVIGTPETIPVLEKLIRTPIVDGVDSPDALAHFAALTSIGTIANRYKLNDDKVTVLKTAQDPQFWQRLMPAKTSAQTPLDEGDIQSLTRDLAIQSLQGYALTGSKQAEDFLKSEKNALPHAALPEPVKKDRDQLLDQALKVNSLSKTQGALKVFDR